MSYIDKKFRVWSKTEKRWITNSIVLSATDGRPLLFFTEVKDDKKVVNHVYLVDKHEPVVQQYTGLIDKIGQEIYEGDIVKYKYNYEYDKQTESIREVKFCKGSFYPLPVDDINDGDDFYSCRIVEYKIIGNILENPELLEN